jgi:hypothetical protein
MLDKDGDDVVSGMTRLFERKLPPLAIFETRFPCFQFSPMIPSVHTAAENREQA